MGACNIQVCFSKFEPRLQRTMIQVSHWCFHHLHPKARVSKPAQCLSPVFFSTLISPLIFFGTDRTGKHILGKSKFSWNDEKYLVHNCFPWAQGVRVLDKCIPPSWAMHGHSFARLLEFHEDPVEALLLSPIHLIRKSTGTEESQHLVPWVDETQSRAVKLEGEKDPEKIHPLWVVKSDKNYLGKVRHGALEADICSWK